ncbi:37s ribosomal protein rsm22 [Ophiostoma piceae UAMH 11346]|uniref:37s ribosomal protein rsm22 n=1 Tax=Ophiostoma piceae (strain UAMH 11346) TaxID=1262450 RepID=S3C8W9_OPHP1|nr:37s ribosomal protein rsm22 [Ophiostoma piceae UAMH 11346]
MYRKELQRACPRSQAWLLQAFEAAASTSTTATTRTTSTSTTARRQFMTAREGRAREQRGLASPRRRGQAQRLLSTTHVRNEAANTEAAKDAKPADAADAADGDLPLGDETESIETIVRQAKATFGDTLPKDYLNAEELKLYQRLYGAPIRETHPVDVGIPRSDEDFPYRDVVAEKQNELFRETPNGYLEQVEYTRHEIMQMEAEFEGQFDPVHESESTEHDTSFEPTEPIVTETTEPSTTLQLTESTESIDSIKSTEPEILTGTQIDYIQAVAKNKRELAALMKLQRDFETSRAATMAEREAQEANEAAIMETVEEQQAREEEQEENENDEEYPEEEEEVDEELQQEMLADPNYRPRLHPLSIEGHGRPNPSTVNIPKRDVVLPITDLLRRTDISHVRQAAYQVFGGHGLPYSAHTPKPKAGKKGTGGNQNFEQRPVALSATQRRMSPIEADVYMSTVLPTTYASTMNTLVEVRKRLGPKWIQGLLERSRRGDGSLRVLDIGGGGGALAAWNQVFRSEVEVLRERGVLPRRAQVDEEIGQDDVQETQREEEDTEVKSRKDGRNGRFLVEKAVVVGNEELSFRASQFLNNTSFLPRLPDLLHSAENVGRHLDAPETPHPTMAKRKTYDVIIATHQIMGVDRPHQRRQIVDNLWANLNPNGGVLIVVEKGHPRGFEAVAYARQRLLDVFITPPPQSKEEAANPSSIVAEETPTDASETAAAKAAAGIYTSHRSSGMIVAPCTNHGKCPMYLRPGLTAGRKDFCHFSQRYIRPPFLQKIMNQSHRNHEDIQFSYVAVQRGSSPNAEKDVMEDVFAVAMGQAPPRVMPLVQGKEATEAAFAGYQDPEAEAEAEAEGQTETAETIAPEKVPHMLTLPRVYMAPLKRRGHVILDVCTPEGKLERWTVPRSYGKQAYHDARKASWGDLWALGGKTRIPREPRMGKDRKQAADAKRDEAEAELRDEEEMEDYLDEAEMERLQALTKASMVIKQKSTDNLLEHVNKNSLKAQAESAKVQAKKNKKKWDRQFKGYKGYKKQKQSRKAAAEQIMKAIGKQDGFE